MQNIELKIFIKFELFLDDSEIVDLSSTWSFNNEKKIMAQIIQNQLKLGKVILFLS